MVYYLITFDFLDMRRAADMGIGNDDEMREVLVVRDVATRAIAAIPTMSRNTEDVVEALKRLIGRRKVKLAYSDVALEFDAAMAQLRIPINHSLPGLPKNNSLAERTNQEVINTVATSLLHAGLPHLPAPRYLVSRCRQALREAQQGRKQLDPSSEVSSQG